MGKEKKRHGPGNARKACARGPEKAAHAEGGAFVCRRLPDRQEEEVPPLRDLDDRGVRDDRRGEGPYGLRAVREGQAQIAQEVPAPPKRHPEPRHVPPRPREDRPEALQRRDSEVAGVHRGRHGRRHIDRRQASAQGADDGLQDAMHRKCPLAPHEARDRPGQGRREIQRDHSDPQPSRRPVPKRRNRHDRRGRMPEEDRQEDTEARRGLHHIAQGQP